MLSLLVHSKLLICLDSMIMHENIYVLYVETGFFSHFIVCRNCVSFSIYLVVRYMFMSSRKRRSHFGWRVPFEWHRFRPAHVKAIILLYHQWPGNRHHFNGRWVCVKWLLRSLSLFFFKQNTYWLTAKRIASKQAVVYIFSESNKKYLLWMRVRKICSWLMSQFWIYFYRFPLKDH